MNFDRINSLTSYFTGSDTSRPERPNEPLQPPGVSDWGIEETASNAGSSLYYTQPFNANLIHGLNSSTLFHEDEIPKNFAYYYHKYSDRQIPATTENFSKFIKHYMGVKSHREFWENFKYNLIVSNLLDDSMILSKNDQLLNTLISVREKKARSLKTFVQALNNDGTELILDNRAYRLKFPHTLHFKGHILTAINMIIHLLKQTLNQSIASYALLKAFKIVIIIATKLVKFIRASLFIQRSKVLGLLDDFLMNNFRINKKLISNLISLKEMELFNFMNKNNQVPTKNVFQFKSHLNSSIDFLIFNLRSSVIKLLPILSGPVFEKYCNINNIDIFAICANDETEGHEENVTVDRIVAKINKFNKLRKLLVCQLLTIDEKTEKSFFLLKVYDLFELSDYEHEIEELQDLSVFEKLLTLEELFVDHNKVLLNFTILFEKLEKLTRINNLNIKDEDILKQTVDDSADDSNLDHMILSINKLLTNLKFFKKYNQSTLNNPDEANEKLFIFNQFKDEIASIRQLHDLNIQDLQYQFESQEERKSENSSARTSRTSGEFNLKSFHTMNASSSKKRYSLPTKQLQSPLNSTNKEVNSPRIDSQKRDSYNRLSTGLKLGLLTVFEEGKERTAKSAKQLISYDDNYINILPPANYYTDTYNQAALDSLSKRSRFSINSLNSSSSEFLTSTQVTSFEEEDINHLSKDELRLKLEESLSRIYTLEKQSVKPISTEVEDLSSDIKNEANETGQETISKTFLDNLEATLGSRRDT